MLSYKGKVLSALGVLYEILSNLHLTQAQDFSQSSTPSLPSIEELKEAYKDGWNRAVDNFHDRDAEDWAWTFDHDFIQS
jgi:hypothetical protein